MPPKNPRSRSTGPITGLCVSDAALLPSSDQMEGGGCRMLRCGAFPHPCLSVVPGLQIFHNVIQSVNPASASCQRFSPPPMSENSTRKQKTLAPCMCWLYHQADTAGPEEVISVCKGFDGRLEDGEHVRTTFELLEQSACLFAVGPVALFLLPPDALLAITRCDSCLSQAPAASLRAPRLSRSRHAPKLKVGTARICAVGSATTGWRGAGPCLSCTHFMV